MARETMKYGTIEFEVKIPEEQIAAELESNAVELPKRTTAEHIHYALEHPIDSAPLNEIVHAGETVCIVISDVTRRWQSPETYIPILIEELNKDGIKDEDILIISATGTHRRQTKEEHIGLVTEEIYNRIKIVDHQCTDTDNLTYMGTTSRETPVWLDSRAVACDRLILTGGVVYHFLAGFGGGRKSIVPGIAGRETIMKNHNLALNPGFGNGSNPNVRSANMNETNPFHMDLMEAAAMAHPDFLLNVVVNGDQQIIGAFAGNYAKAHQEACNLVDSIDGVYVEEKTPLVIASAGGFPKDLNLYQTSKTICNALEVVSDGGTMILVSKCSEAFGDPDCERLINGYPDMLEREKSLRENFSIGAYIGYLFAESAEKYNLIVVTEISQENFGTAKIHAVKTLDEALEKAKELNGGKLDMRTTLLPHGANTLPKFKK